MDSLHSYIRTKTTFAHSSRMFFWTCHLSTTGLGVLQFPCAEPDAEPDIDTDVEQMFDLNPELDMSIVSGLINWHLGRQSV